MKKVIAIAIFIMLAHSINSSAEESPWRVGVYGGLNLNMHSPSFNFPYYYYEQLDTNYFYAPFNNSGMGFGGHLGALVDYKINNDFSITGRFGINGLSGSFEQEGNTVNNYLYGSSTNFQHFDVKNELSASIMYFEITPAIKLYNIVPVDNVYLLGGLELGIPIYADAQFINTRTEDNFEIINSEISISDVNTRFALAVGVGYDYEISKNVYLSPELSFRIPFTDISSTNNTSTSIPTGYSSWNASQIRFGVNLSFGFESEDEPMPPAEPISTINVKFDKITYQTPDNKTKPVEKIVVEEVSYNELFPFIPYVFFDENSETPSSKTQVLTTDTETGDFTITALEADAVTINKSTLDIIGTRMKKDNKTTINIIGTNDGKGETKNKELSKKRAEFAKNYLIVNYGISPDRITTKWQNAPSKPSSQTQQDGIEENRRIEIATNNSNLIEPILVQSDKKTFAQPTIIEFTPLIETTDTLKNWQLEISQSDRVLKQINGENIPTSIKWSIQPNDLVSSQIPIDYYLVAENVKGKSSKATGSIPVEYLTYSRGKTEDRPDKTISKFSLVVFDFNSPEISDTDINILKNHVIPAIKYNSTVQIYGYTDRIGDSEYNKNLASQRAENTKNILQPLAKSAKYEVYGIGEDVLLNDNNLTIGRQLSRTVQIYVITPKQ